MIEATDLVIAKHVPTIAAAINSLAAMERQLDTAKTYEEIRRTIDEAHAIKILFKHIAEVQARAEDAVLLGNRRIAEELRKVPKATRAGPGRGNKQMPSRGQLFSGREATGIHHTTRLRFAKLADVPKDEIKAVADKLRGQGKDATPTAVVREITQGDKKERRAQREVELAANITALPDKRFGVIFADPEWRFEPYSRETGMDRAADNHYPTSELDAIKARDVSSIAANNCVLFLCATAPMLPQALEVMLAWGFVYKSQAVWTKDKVGTGYWFRNCHELLLVGVRGEIPAPAMGTQWESVIAAPVSAHSAKPEAFYELIEAYFPNLPKIELNARRRREGWEAWGLEAEAAE